MGYYNTCIMQFQLNILTPPQNKAAGLGLGQRPRKPIQKGPLGVLIHPKMVQMSNFQNCPNSSSDRKPSSF
jgi:hypothetical protein